MKNVNQVIAQFLATTNESNYTKRNISGDLQQIAMSVNHNTTDSGWHTPKAIKANGVDGILFLRESGQINPEYKAVQNGNTFDLFELTLSAYNRLERFARKIAPSRR